MMKKIGRIILIASFLVILIALEGCTFVTPIKKPVTTEIKHSMGLKPLPRDFLKWWFNQVPTFNSKVSMLSEREPTNLIEKDADIMNTQQCLISPVASDLPSNFDLRDVNGTSKVTPVKNQGANGTCWAFSTIGSLESALLVQLGPSEIESRYPFISDPNSPDLSEQFLSYHDVDWEIMHSYQLAYQESNRDDGGSQFFSFYEMVRRGIPLEKDFPYLTSSQSWIEWNPQDTVWTNHLIKPTKTLVIPDATQFSTYTSYINTIKSAIKKYGALSVSFAVYNNFFSIPTSSGCVYSGPTPTSHIVGYHAVLLVGWNDDWTYNGIDYGPVWIVKNSWSSSWGDQGYWRQPMLTEQEFNSGSIPAWKFENNSMWVPYFGI